MTFAKRHELQEGDAINVWWRPQRDTIIELRKYTGPFDFISSVAEFASGVGMSIERNTTYIVYNR